MKPNVREVLYKFGKALDKHYDINDFGCEGCQKIIDEALAALNSIVNECIGERMPEDDIANRNYKHGYNTAKSEIRQAWKVRVG